MIKLEELMGFDPKELKELTDQIEANQKVHKPSLLERSAKVGYPLKPENLYSRLAEGYTGKSTRLTEELLSIPRHFNKLPEVSLAFRLLKEIPNIAAILGNLANRKAEELVALLPELLGGVNIESNASQSDELKSRITELKNETVKNTDSKNDDATNLVPLETL